MGSFVISNFHTLTLFVWITSVLTTSVNQEGKTDGTQISNAAVTVGSALLEKEHQLSSTTHPPQQPGNFTKISNENVMNVSLAGEGGPISIVPTTQQTFSTTVHLANISESLNTESNNTPKVTGRIPNKIVSRKGAPLPNPDLERSSLSPVKESATGDGKAISEPGPMTENSHNVQQNSSTNMNTESLSTTMKYSDELSNNHGNKTSPHDTSVVEQKSTTNASVKVNPTPKKHKPKPTATVVNSRTDDEKPMPAMPTRSSPLGMPRKIDYIVPVIITIVALPLLGAATFMVYRRGRDCWDKRHYRRMDFLIDGMYND